MLMITHHCRGQRCSPKSCWGGIACSGIHLCLCSVPMQVCAVLCCATHAGLRSGAFSMFKSLGKKSVCCGAFSMFKHLWVRAQVWVAFQAIRCFQGGNQLGELHSRMAIVPVDLYMFGSTDCRPEWPTGNAWVVFDDNQVWATCWNGGRGGMAV